MNAHASKTGFDVDGLVLEQQTPTRVRLQVGGGRGDHHHVLVVVPADLVVKVGEAVSTPGSPWFGRIPDEAPIIATTSLVPPGQHAELELTLDEGQYGFLCGAPGHYRYERGFIDVVAATQDDTLPRAIREGDKPQVPDSMVELTRPPPGGVEPELYLPVLPRQKVAPEQAQAPEREVAPEPTASPAVDPNPTNFHVSEVRVKRKVVPVYPEAAKAAGAEDADCRVLVSIDRKGRPISVGTDRCPAVFRESAETAVMQWRWHPARDGEQQKVPAKFHLNIKYHLR